MTLLVQEAPTLRLRTLDALLTMAGKSGRRDTQLAIDTLTDLFINTLLPKRPLRCAGFLPLLTEAVLFPRV